MSNKQEHNKQEQQTAAQIAQKKLSREKKNILKTEHKVLGVWWWVCGRLEGISASRIVYGYLKCFILNQIDWEGSTLYSISIIALNVLS